MSLDVYLRAPAAQEQCRCETCGTLHVGTFERELFKANITHNLGAMADAAGIYEVLWHPEEAGIDRAEQLIEPLARGLAWLLTSEAQAKEHNAKNGWGKYEDFVPWVTRYLEACKQFPHATVRVSR